MSTPAGNGAAAKRLPVNHVPRAPAPVAVASGRVPPHDLDAEAAVLSACIVSNGKALDAVISLLQPNHYFSEAHRRIYEACLALRVDGKPIDIVQVGSWLKDQGRIAQVGGMPYLTNILNAAPTLDDAHVAAYGKTVVEKARIRRLIDTCQVVVAEAYGDYGDVDEFVERASSDLRSACAAPTDDTHQLTLWAPELAQALPPQRFVCCGLTIAPGRPSVFVGEGGTRKGWLAMAMQVCGAADRMLLNRFQLREGMRSLYIDYEQTERVSRERYYLLAAGLGVRLAALERRLGYRWRPMNTLAPREVNENQRAIDSLSRLAEGIDLVIIDSVRACSPGIDENGVFASIPFDIATAASVKTGATFLFLDHAGKPRDDEGTGRARKHAQRGHSSKIDAGQTQFVLSARKGEATLVTCERAQTVPKEEWPPDFRFTLHRTSDGGLTLQEIASPETKTDEQVLEDLGRLVLEKVRANPGLNNDEVRERVGRRRSAVVGALSYLERKQLVVNKGSRKVPSWLPL